MSLSLVWGVQEVEQFSCLQMPQRFSKLGLRAVMECFQAHFARMLSDLSACVSIEPLPKKPSFLANQLDIGGLIGTVRIKFLQAAVLRLLCVYHKNMQMWPM